MNKLKLILYKVLIIYLILYIILGTMSSCFARGYDDACGEYVSQYARDFIEKYCHDNSYYDNSTAEAHWGGNSFGEGIFYCCCSSGVKYMFDQALGINLYEHDFAGYCATALEQMQHSEYWDEVSFSDLQPGDVVVASPHTEFYIGNNQTANFGNMSPNSAHVRDYTSPEAIETGLSPNYIAKAFRLKSSVDVNPSGKVGASKGGGAGEYQKIDYSHFYFNGVPDGKYSLASKEGFFKLLINSLKDIIDYYIGLETYLIRMVFVGWTGIFDNILNWSVTTILDTNAEEEAETGVKGVEVDKTETGDREVNIETLVFNKFRILDVNVFKEK